LLIAMNIHYTLHTFYEKANAIAMFDRCMQLVYNDGEKECESMTCRTLHTTASERER